MEPPFDPHHILSYLQLPLEYSPSPATQPIPFLAKHVTHLPPQLLPQFNVITTAKQRTAVPIIRNRRLKFATRNPSQFSYATAFHRWPALWQGIVPRGLTAARQDAHEEKQWGEMDFLQGSTQYVGKLGSLLGEYEEEREAERVRMLRRERAATEAFIPEQDSDSDDDEASTFPQEDDTPEEAKATFERRVQEHFIYGLLAGFEYDAVDWDDSLDSDDEREAEERWFDDDDELVD